MRRYRGYYQPRSIRRIESKQRKKFLWTIIISILILGVFFFWGLPWLINQFSFLNKAAPIAEKEAVLDTTLAPPVLNIPFEATNSATLVIKGYSSPNSKVKIYIDDSLVATEETETDGNFRTNQIELSLGTNNIYGVTEGGNNIKSLPSKTIQLIYQNEKPVLEVNSPEDGKEIKGGDKKVEVSGTTNPENEVLVNGTRVIVNFEGKFQTSVNLQDGENTVIVSATNQVGTQTTTQRKVIYTPS